MGERLNGEKLERLVRDHEALRRVATLVAQQPPQEEVFAAVTREAAMLLDARMSALLRVESPAEAVILAGWSRDETPVPVGSRGVLDGRGLVGQIVRSGRPVRLEDYDEVGETVAEQMREIGVRSAVAGPIVLGGRIWGALSAAWPVGVPIPVGAEDRVAAFAELVSYAIDNAEIREDLQRLADEQAALRRIATLAARGSGARAVFDAVCEETGRLFAAASVNLAHFTPDGFNETMAGWSLRGVHVPTGTLLPLEGESINAVVRDTAAPARFDSYERSSGELAARLRRLGIRSEVGAPVIVDGQVWGALIAGTDEHDPLSPRTEFRLAKFAELIAIDVSNATARSELIASRSRIVQAADEQRRRVVRDLHDGAQQRLVHAAMTLQLAHGESDAPPELARLVEQALEHTTAAIDELRELAHGIHPALLTTRGLAAAVESLADRAPVSVRIEIPEERYPASVESAAYFVVAEALTNVAKYARASAARVAVTHRSDSLVIEVEDDGVGGAKLATGSGLAGLRDRLAAFQGQLIVDSPPARGTRLRAEIPLATGAPTDASAADSHV
ncbi:MAG: sensor histidine kinase [Solirubrobacteraceae bacterium]